MMYIEHTALEDNLHHILTNRVPTSSSPGATEAAAVAASALLARVREAQNGASLLSAPQVPQTTESTIYKEWSSRRPEPKLLPVQSLKKLCQTPKEQTTVVTDLTQIEDDGLEEEQYELLHVVDTDQQEEAQTESKTSVKNGSSSELREKIGDSLCTTHFVIDLEDAGLQNKTEGEEEEFEYVVTRVPRRRSHSQNHHQSHLGPHTGQGDSRTPTSQIHSQGPQRAKRPVPGAIPIGYHQRKLHNGKLKATDVTEDTGNRGSRTQDYLLRQSGLNGYPEPYVVPEDSNYYLDLTTAEEGPENACNNERCKKDAQIGMDILSKIGQIFSWKKSPSSDHYNTAQQESKRKRRSDDLLFDDYPRDVTIKYRKVDNRFPKYVEHTEEHDAMNFLPPPTAQSSKQFQSNMSARRSTSSIDKTPLRKSMFSAPNKSTILVKNTSYADIEFSDEDEAFVIKPSTSAAAKHLPKVYNIPIVRADERDNCRKQRQLPPPLIEHRTGNILTSSLISEQDYGRKHKYANAMCQNRTRETAERNGHVLGTRNSSISSFGRASTSDSSRLQNGLNSLRTNHWSNITRSSILAQERESEQREKYQQLLEKVVPRLYGSSTENKIPTTTSAQSRRSALLLGAASSSSRSSSANARRSVGLSQSILKRPPLSSTINLDDDHDDDVVLLKPPNRQSRGKPIVPTIIIDDDDISDIVELGTADRHVLSQVGKIKQEENSLLSLCADKSKKPKNNALPYVEPVNSLKDRFSASPHIKDNWLDNWHSKWWKRKCNRLVEVKETAEVAEKFAAERRAAEAEIQERLRRFQIVDPELLVVDDFEDLIPEPEFVELTDEHRAQINTAVFGGRPDQVLISKFNLNITRRDIHTLCGHSWLNDEVINFYMNLLTERGDLKQSQGLPSVYAMNTFFLPRLLQAGHDGVKRWTRKVDIFAKDIIPLPVHVGGVHWCMAIIHMKNRTIKYYDSMGTPNHTVLKALEQYLKDESLDKRKRPFDTSGFQIESVQGVPRQMNGSDCGVFSCMFAEYITRDKEINFSQQNMEYFRQKMILEIVTGELLQ